MVVKVKLGIQTQNGKDLPWVESADHLGHTLNQQVTMEKDCLRARAKFIDKSSDLRDKLHHANEVNVIRAIQLLCSDAYGSMLWDLSSDYAEQYFKSWNTMVKLVHRVPRDTFTYLVEGYFANGLPSLRNQVLSRYPKFIRSLQVSNCKEVRVLASLVKSDPRSTTNRNIQYLKLLTKLNAPQEYSSWRIRTELPIRSVPEAELSRVGFLDKLRIEKKQKFLNVNDMEKISAMLDSLCNT